MNNQEKLTVFFKVENERDWETYRKFISPDVVWELHSCGHTKIEGIENYLNTIKAAYEGNANSFVVESFYSGMDDTRIAAILRNNLGDRSCDIFEFKDGLIVREYEFIL